MENKMINSSKLVSSELISSEGGLVLRGALIVFVLLAVGVVSLGYTFGYVVEPGRIGVRQVKFNIPGLPEQGFSKTGLEPGYHWSIPFYSTIHFVPQTVQVLHLHRDRELYPETPGALEVQTKDGSSVTADVSIFARYFSTPGENNGGPSDLISEVGPTEPLWHDRIETAAVNELKANLGGLSTSEFYDPELRENKIIEAQSRMNERLNPMGIQIDAILLRRYTYLPEIDNAIFQKNLQDQEQRRNFAASQREQEKADLRKIEAEWDAKILTLSIQGEQEATAKIAEAEGYQKEKTAQGDLLVAKAEAEVERLKASALSEAGGVNIYIAKEMAAVLGTLRGGVVTDLDPYDVDEWAKKLGAGQ